MTSTSCHHLTLLLSLPVICILFVLIQLPNSSLVECNESKIKPNAGQVHAPPTSKPRKLPKDPLYITDVDLEHLYDQWEESDDEKLPPDELEPHKRPQQSFKPPPGESKEELFKDPEKLMMASKRGKTVMAFVAIGGNPSKDKTEQLTTRWQMGLTNNHISCERYVIGDDRAIFVFHNGIQAFEAKDFFLEQPELKEYSVDSRVWHGKNYPVEYPNAKKENVSKDGGDSAAAKASKKTKAKAHDEL
uniref:LDLR chaperone boca n=1 Tax=Aceria tosichella TaxID=561515 RepID=A0A6G1S4U2_9ACAR